jgi:hypothetical protein
VSPLRVIYPFLAPLSSIPSLRVRLFPTGMRATGRTFEEVNGVNSKVGQGSSYHRYGSNRARMTQAKSKNHFHPSLSEQHLLFVGPATSEMHKQSMRDAFNFRKVRAHPMRFAV